MNPLKNIASLALLILVSACTVPVSSDFKQSDEPLSEKEVIIEWRLSRDASAVEVYPATEQIAEKTRVIVDPFMRQFIPRLFADIRSGKLTLYNGGSLEEGLGTHVTNIAQSMADAYGASWQRLEPFMKVFHLRERRDFTQHGSLKNILELVIIVTDPEGKGPERYFGGINMKELADLNYTFEIEEEEVGLAEYLADQAFFKMIPVRMAMHAESASLVALNEAYHVKGKIAAGQFGELVFLNERLNSANLKPVKVPMKKLAELQGLFVFRKDGEILKVENEEEVYLTVKLEGDQLVAQWSHFYLPQELYAASETRLFTLHGMVLDYELDEKGMSQIKLTDTFEHVDAPAVLGVITIEE